MCSSSSSHCREESKDGEVAESEAWAPPGCRDPEPGVQTLQVPGSASFKPATDMTTLTSQGVPFHACPPPIGLYMLNDATKRLKQYTNNPETHHSHETYSEAEDLE